MNSKFDFFLDPDINEEDFNKFVELIKYPEFLAKLGPLPDELDLTKREQVENLYLYFKLNIKMDDLIKELNWVGDIKDNYIKDNSDKVDDFCDKIDEVRQHVFNVFNNHFKDPKLYFQFEAISNSLYTFGELINRDDLLLFNININKDDGCLTVSDPGDGERDDPFGGSDNGNNGKRDNPFEEKGDKGNGKRGNPFEEKGDEGKGENEGASDLTL